MKYSWTFYLLIITTILLIFSCQNKSELTKEFSCKNTKELSQLESVDDFNKNFTVRLPKHWNTKLYYDSVQSEIFSADTIKSLTESYIMDFAMVLSPIEVSGKLQNELLKKSADNDMETIKESFHNFQGYDAYAHLGVGKNKNYTFYVFQYYIGIDKERYMRIKTEFYSDNHFDSRFCEALSLIETIKIH